MEFQVLRSIIDFGLVVLIWMVQLIIYPGFKYYGMENLMAWHSRYTVLIGCIVVPLMLAQLVLAAYLAFIKPFQINILIIILIGIIWIVTFLRFVPMHKKITNGFTGDGLLKNLLQENWIRTLLWTVVFALSFLDTA